ncbi:MAG: hypothetical protein CMB80_02160 [Flammeovirgaceae bacterium]|nr:hypothetical protein [Flammeovirgaceae bacterium]|tara:strand:+ start:213 stop:452 length:240 start_codon:yes stop_codon:yes gene_type:complete
MRPIDILLEGMPGNTPIKIAREAIIAGRTRLFCPQCLKNYTPAFATKEQAMANGNAIEREQWITGYCSDKCWDECFGEE